MESKLMSTSTQLGGSLPLRSTHLWAQSSIRKLLGHLKLDIKVHNFEIHYKLLIKHPLVKDRVCLISASRFYDCKAQNLVKYIYLTYK